jgi:hypothetical protein
MEDWLYDEEWPVKKGKIYVLAWYPKSPYRVLTTMIYRIYDEENITHFRMEWFPMAYKVSKNDQAFN